MPQFRKKPVVIEAIQYTGINREEAIAFGPGIEWSCGPEDRHPGYLHIKTLEGRMEASAGDWIIRGVAGEYYPCKDPIFQATYELVEDSDPASARRSEHDGS